MGRRALLTPAEEPARRGVQAGLLHGALILDTDSPSKVPAGPNRGSAGIRTKTGNSAHKLLTYLNYYIRNYSIASFSRAADTASSAALRIRRAKSIGVTSLLVSTV